MSSSSPLPAPMRPSAARHRAKARLVNSTLVAALVSVSVPGLATSASADIVEPAPSPFAVTIFPERDFVSVNWDGAGSTMAAEADVASPGTETDTRAAASMPLTRQALARCRPADGCTEDGKGDELDIRGPPR